MSRHHFLIATAAILLAVSGCKSKPDLESHRKLPPYKTLKIVYETTLIPPKGSPNSKKVKGRTIYYIDIGNNKIMIEDLPDIADRTTQNFKIFDGERYFKVDPVNMVAREENLHPIARSKKRPLWKNGLWFVEQEALVSNGKVLGRECAVIKKEFRNIWVWSGIILKEEKRNTNGTKTIKKAVKIEEDINFDPRQFTLPGNITLLKPEEEKEDIEERRRSEPRLSGMASSIPRIDVIVHKPAIPGLIKDLNDGSDETRVRAAALLGSTMALERKVVKALAKALKDENSDVRKNAVTSLGALKGKSKKAVPELAEVMRKDPDEEIRKSACYALVEIGPDAAAATPTLIKLINRSEFRSSGSSCIQKALGAIGPKALPHMKRAMETNDKPPKQKNVATMGLEKERNKGHVSLLKQNILETVEKEFGPAGKDFFSAFLEDENEAVRAYAQTALDDLERTQNEKKYDDPIRENLSSDNARALFVQEISLMSDREKAQTAKELIQWEGWRPYDMEGKSTFFRMMEFLLAIGTAADPVYVELLKDEDLFNRYGTLLVLLSRDDTPEEFIPILIERLDDENKAIQYTAISDLKRYGPKAKVAVPKFIDLLQTENKYAYDSGYVPAKAQEALQNVSPNAIALLINELKKSDPLNRAAAAKALGRWIPFQYSAGIYQREYALNEVIKALPALEIAATDENEDVKKAAAKAITDINLAKAQVYKEIAPHDEEKRKASLQPLEKIFFDETADVNTRMNVFKKIMEIEQESRPKYKSQLITIFKTSADGTPAPNGIYAFEQATNQLCQLDLGEEKDLLIPYALKALYHKSHSGPGAAARFIVSFDPNGEKTMPNLIEALQYSHRPTQRAAAWALREMGPKAKKAVPALIDVLKGTQHDWERKDYIETLKKIGTKKALRAAERYEK